MLTKKHRAIIDTIINNPTLSYTDVAKMVGVKPKTIYNLKQQNPEYKAALEKSLEEKWSEAKYQASATMINLMQQGDFKAAKYILDYCGYAPAQKIEADIDTTITVRIGADED